jgi:hypothetical protein
MMSLQYVKDLLTHEFGQGGFFYEARHRNLNLDLAWAALGRLDKITADGLTMEERMEAALLIYDWPYHLQGWIRQASDKGDFDQKFIMVLREIHRVIDEKMKLLLATS